MIEIIMYIVSVSSLGYMIYDLLGQALCIFLADGSDWREVLP